MQNADSPLLCAIEGGGTKFTCALGRSPDDAILSPDFPTGDDPARLVSMVCDWIRQTAARCGAVRAIGLASFGPLDLDPQSKTHGFITSTPKNGWRNFNLLGAFQAGFPGLPIAFDTDVNGAALGEHRWGRGAGLADFVYVTMGTGIGVGGLSNGRPLRGMTHPEMGHMLIPRVAGDDFAGVCPYHGDCWEGLCSGPAIRARTGTPAEELEAGHSAWDLVALYTATALANIVLTLSPRRIILGGSVRRAGHLGEKAFFARIRNGLQTRLNGYLDLPAFTAGIDDYIVPPALKYPGVYGAMCLAQSVLPQSKQCD
jgi:fructokinase